MDGLLNTGGLQALLAQGGMVLLPQAYAAQVLRQRLTVLSPATPTRSLLGWREWLEALWTHVLTSGREDRVLLNRLQETQLWTEVIGADAPFSARTATEILDLAMQARAALQRAAELGIVDQLSSGADTADARAFARWYRTFVEHCEKERVLAGALLDRALLPHLASGALPLVDRLHLAGFERLTPAQRQVLKAVQHAGVSVEQHAVSTLAPDGNVRKTVLLETEREELRFAIRRFALESESHPDQSLRFALVCDQQEEHRSYLERLLREIIAPELEEVGADLSSTPWRFSRQPSLRSLPLIHDALALLRWMRAPLPLEHIAHLLRSPSFLDVAEVDMHARHARRLASDLPTLRGSLTMPEFLAMQSDKDRSQEDDYPALKRTAHLLAKLERERSMRSAAEWSDQARRLLLESGWPGARELTPSLMYAQRGWEDLLDSVSTLQLRGSRMTFDVWLRELEGEADQQPVPCADLDTPVQVLGFAETEGLAFDLCVVVGANNNCLPATPGRNALLPFGLQRRLGVGDAWQEFENARAAMEGLSQRSRTLILSVARDAEGGEQELTSLATELHFVPVEPAVEVPAEPARIPVLTETVFDPEVMPLASSTRVRGGADVLRLQAACGFQAFAKYRLLTDDTSPRTLGLDPRESGNILHGALELFWQDVKSHASLLALTEAERKEHLEHAVERAMVSWRRAAERSGDAWTKRYLEIVKTRFSRLLTRWVQMELTRKPFQVLAREQKRMLTLGPLELSLRPDRIDSTADGEVIVDYKSSFALSHEHWLDERPEAPQLPAYALCTDPGTLRGIAFAQVRPGERMRWISVTDTPGLFPRSHQVDMGERVELWREELTRLAVSFAAGNARVNPKSYPGTCKFCALRSLCRLDPVDVLEEERGSADGEDTLG